MILRAMPISPDGESVAENHHPGSSPPPGIAGQPRRQVTSLLQSRLTAPLLLLLLTIGFFWKLVLTNQYTWLGGPDIARQVLPWFQYQVGEWQRGRLPLWEPYQWGGQPLAAQAQPGALYPPNWLLFLAPTRHGWLKPVTLHWYFVLIHYMAALFCYLLCRDLGRSRAAGVLAGIVFAFGGYVGNTDWPQMLNGAVWTPVVFLFLLRILRGQNPLASAALCGFFLGVSFLSGHHQVPIFVSYATALTLLFHLGRAVWLRQDAARAAMCLVIVVAMAGMAGAAQMMPAWEYSQLAYRWVGLEDPVGGSDKVPYHVLAHYGLWGTGLFGLFVPGLWNHTNLFVGITALGFALLGFALGWQYQAVRVLSAVGLGGLLYALGGDFIGGGIAYSLFPALDKSRNVSVAIILSSLTISVLVSYGLDEVLRIKHSKWIDLYKRACVAIAVLMFAVTYLYFLQTGGDFRTDVRALIVMLTGLLGALAIHGWQNGKLTQAALIATIGAILLTDLSHGNLSQLPPISDRARNAGLYEMSYHGDVAAWLRNQPPPFRVSVDDQVIRYNFGDWHGIEVIGGYLASLTKEIYDLGPWGENASRLYGVRYHVGAAPTGAWNELVYESKSGVHVYRRSDVLPLARVVQKVEKLPETVSLQHFISAQNIDLYNVAYLPGDLPELEQCAQGAARIVERTSSRVTVAATANCRGLLVLADNYYPGWVATVDGQSAPLYRAYGVARAVVVEKGAHRVEFRFWPRSVYWGAALSLLALAFAITVWIRSRRSTVHPQ